MEGSVEGEEEESTGSLRSQCGTKIVLILSVC